jgi:hypothetical protein
MRAFLYAIAILLLPVIMACTKQPATEQSAIVVPQAKPEPTAEPLWNCEAKWCHGKLVVEQLTPRMLAANPGIYCPRYKDVDMRSFWIAFSKAVTRAESAWKPAYGMTENFNDGLTGKPAESVGMWQLSVGDKLNYRTANCKDLDDKKLVDAEKNMRCGLEIIDARLQRDVGVKFQSSLGKYWSTIRDNKNPTDSSKTKKVTLAETVRKYFPACF